MDAHLKTYPQGGGRLRRSGVCFGSLALLTLCFFLPLSYYAQSTVYCPPAAFAGSGGDPPDAVLNAAAPLAPNEDDACTFWDAASSFEKIWLPSVTAPPGFSSVGLATFCDLPVHFSDFKLLVSAPRSPPIHL